MKNLASRGLLSVEDMNALFEERLRVSLPGGSFKVIQHNYSNTGRIKVYGGQLPMSMVIRLQPEGHITPLNPVPEKANGRLTGAGSRTN